LHRFHRFVAVVQHVGRIEHPMGLIEPQDVRETFSGKVTRGMTGTQKFLMAKLLIY
jgi:hypothetical protein